MSSQHSSAQSQPPQNGALTPDDPQWWEVKTGLPERITESSSNGTAAFEWNDLHSGSGRRGYLEGHIDPTQLLQYRQRIIDLLPAEAAKAPSLNHAIARFAKTEYGTGSLIQDPGEDVVQAAAHGLVQSGNGMSDYLIRCCEIAVGSLERAKEEVRKQKEREAEKEAEWVKREAERQQRAKDKRDAEQARIRQIQEREEEARRQKADPQEDVKAMHAKIKDVAGQVLSPTELDLALHAIATEYKAYLPNVERFYRNLIRQDDEQDARADSIEAIKAEAHHRREGQLLHLDLIFHPRIANALAVITHNLPFEAPAIAITYLAGVSACVPFGSRVMAVPASNYSVPINLYAAVVGRSGAKKTVLMKLLIKELLQPIVDDIRRDHINALNDYTAELARCKQGDPKPIEPKEKYVYFTGGTSEAIAEQLAVHEKEKMPLLLLRDELMGMLNGLNQYKSNGKGDGTEQLLELFDGAGSTDLRVKGNRHFGSSQFNVFGNIQPALYSDLVRGGDPNGKFARILAAPLPATAKQLPTSFTAEEYAELQAANDCLKGVARVIFQGKGTTVELDNFARSIFVNLEFNAQKRAQAADDGSAASAIHGKHAAKVLRIAGLLFHLDRAAGENITVIDHLILDRATQLVQYLDAWAVHFNDKAQDALLISGDLKLLHSKAVALQADDKPVVWRELAQRLSTKQRKVITKDSFPTLAAELAAAGVGTFDGTTYTPTHPLLDA